MIRKIGVAAVLMLCCLGCGKASDFVPNVSVNFELPLTDPRLSALHNVGGAVILKGYGFTGLILYHRADGSYAAYDSCSSYQPENKCAVTLDNPSLTATDPCSGAKFLLEDGSPVKAPATRSLRSYNVIVENLQIFVSN